MKINQLDGMLDLTQQTTKLVRLIKNLLAEKIENYNQSNFKLCMLIVAFSVIYYTNV